MTGSSRCAVSIVPGAVLSLRPLKNVQTSPRCSRFAKKLAPEAIVTECPLDRFEIPLHWGVEASPVGQTTPVRVGTFQTVNAAVLGDVYAEHRSVSQAGVEAPLQLGYRGVGRYCLR